MNTFELKSKKWLALATTVTLASMSLFTASASAEEFHLDFDNVQKNSEGILDGDEWSDLGVTLSGQSYRTNNDAKLNLYDSNSTGGQDSDLESGSAFGTPSLGNVLIIQEEDSGRYHRNVEYFERNGVWRPDDDAKGGHINFDFDEAVGFKEFSLLDIDDNFHTRGGTQVAVTGYDANGNTVLDINIDDLIGKFVDEHGSANHGADAQGMSTTYNGVTITQVGNRQGDNSLFNFKVDETMLTRVKFKYDGVSGAIADLKWNTDDGPIQVPEPSAMGGLIMLGAVGTRKYLKRKRDLAATFENS